MNELKIITNRMDTNYIRLLEYKSVDKILEKINKDTETLKQKLEEMQKVIEPEPTPTPISPAVDDEIYVERYEVERTERQLEVLKKTYGFNGFEVGSHR